MTLITEIENSTLKFIWKLKSSWTGKEILSKKSNTGDIKTPDFKLYYRAIAIKTAWHWHKNRHEDQWNRIEDLDMNSCCYSHLIFDKSAKIHNGERQPLQQMLLDICLQKTVARVCHRVLVPTQSRLRTLIYTWNLEASTGKNREYTGNKRHKQILPQ
jgi:hypothetical protein